MCLEIEKVIPAEKIKYDEPMNNHTTFGIGGPADVMAMPENLQEIRSLIQWAQSNDLPFMVIGGGSNLIVRDGGIRGLVIKLASNFDKTWIHDLQIRAQSGIKLSRLAELAADHGLAGLEFAEGIPGNLGGAVNMNAGAYDGEFSQVVSGATVLTVSGEILYLNSEELEFGYRSTRIQKTNDIIVEVNLQLRREDKAVIQQRMQEFSRRRWEKQPLEYPSAGSIFRRPAGRFVGPMIENLGLKGFRIGGAKISAKHAGFIINCGQATARDVLELIGIIKQRVMAEYGIELVTEPLVVGED
ncbi:MAG: UDP-N-acetylmuramate dehydrogenase [Syntrophomonadaceae bacterium]|nr:UDP-N-acetylmuramate dehydrogenase [Syntrophomonadaceae bacterium]